MNKRDYFTNAKCFRCKEQLLLSPINDYCLYCKDCEEDFYSIEVNEIMGDWFEISICMSIDEFEEMLESTKEKFKDACFIGYDNAIEVCDIGFEDIPDSKRIKDIIKYFNLIEE